MGEGSGGTDRSRAPVPCSRQRLVQKLALPRVRKPLEPGNRSAMLSEEDPFMIIQVPRRPRAHPCTSDLRRALGRFRRSQEEASRALLGVRADLAHWRELSSSSSEMDHTEANQVKLRLTAAVEDLQARRASNAAIPSHRHCHHCLHRLLRIHRHRPPARLACSQLDLDELQGAVDNIARDPDKFGIAPDELQRRRSFVSQTRSEANSIRDTLAAARSVKSARKERIERQGLLAGRGSSSCEMASGAVVRRAVVSRAVVSRAVVSRAVVRRAVVRRAVVSRAVTTRRAIVSIAVVRIAIVLVP